jgi:hypothetical protein
MDSENKDRKSGRALLKGYLVFLMKSFLKYLSKNLNDFLLGYNFFALRLAVAKKFPIISPKNKPRSNNLQILSSVE